MNRRTLLGRLAAGAAAVVGGAMVKPAEASQTMTLPAMTPQQMAETLAAAGYFDGKVIIGSRVTLTGAVISAPAGVHIGPFAKECEIVGCSINMSPAAYTRWPHLIASDQDLAEADAWRRSLHETGG